MKRTLVAIPLMALLALGVGLSFAQTKVAVDPTKADAAIKSAFAKAPADWAGRITGDETMLACSAANNAPVAAVAKQIEQRERAAIKYPEDGKLVGDWQKGERIAQSGYGMRFTDYPATSPNGGNCYACHQLTKAEVSYGTIGPSLLEYGKIRKFADAETKAAYEKIYNSHAAFPCSLMPRFGSNGVLTIEQVKDLTGLLMSPDSPVNK
jgi:sulfur-oxidizing protein SoxX